MGNLGAWTAEQFDPALNWADVEWIKKRWGGKLILKGIQDPIDARLAVLQRRRRPHRQQPRRAPARRRTKQPSEALPTIVDAVGQQIEVHMDGGVRSGQDVLQGLRPGRQRHLHWPGHSCMAWVPWAKPV
jgi:L-lactate dehydrogenase (cytochrome)